MSDDIAVPSILAAAIAAAGPMGNNPGAWKGRINEALPHVVAMMHDGSRQWKIAEEVLGASVFVATYVSHELEASSTRVVVKIDTGKATKNYPDGIEPIRTHRTDNAQGRSMHERLNHLQPGDEIVVWKAMESMGDGADANKVRVLVHLETRPKRTDRPAQPAAPGPAPAAVGSDRTAGATSDNPVVERFQSLPGPVKVRVVKRLRDEGITFPDPGDDNVDRFIIIINEEEK